MKKAGKFLKLGIMIISASFITTALHAQSGIYPKKKVASTKIAQHEREQPNENPKKPSKPAIAITNDNSKFRIPVNESGKNVSTGSGSRNCQPITINKPNTITRADFSKLPVDRQQFIQSNLNKYTIVD